MGAVAFDTLKLARKLRDSAEMTQVQAEGVADALAEAMSGAELATKGDIRELELKMDALSERTDARFDALSERTDARFETVLERIDRRAAESDARMVRYVVGVGITVVLAIIGAAWTVARYLPSLLPHS